MTRIARALVLATTVFGISAAETRAADPPGTYVVSMCRVGDRSVPLTDWQRSDTLSTLFSNTCGIAGGSFGFRASGALPSSWPFRVAWRWQAPPDLRLAGFRFDGSLLGAGFIMDARVDTGSAGFGSPVDDRSSGSLWREVRNLNSSTLAFELRCGWPADPECVADGSGAVMEMRQLDMVLRDEYVPSVTRSDLSEVSPARSISGTVPLTTDFVDRGGGLAGVELLVDGLVTQNQSVSSATCAPPHTVLVPCPGAGRITVAFDTTTVPDGIRNVALRLYDVVGNRTTVGPVMAAVHNALPTAAAPLTPAIPGRISLRKATIRTGYASKLAIEGAVAGLDDTPIADTTVEVASRVNARATSFVPASPVTTDAKGRFSIPIGRGPSRVYRLRYGASEAIAEVDVRAPLKLSVSPAKTRNGRAVRFRGSIPGATAPGVRVELQARAGKKWVPFRTAALKRARFSASYRFTNTTARTRYTFRAVVRADPDLPYMPATSDVVSVLVRP